MKKKTFVWIMLILACMTFAGQTLYACGGGGMGGGSGESSESTPAPEV